VHARAPDASTSIRTTCVRSAVLSRALDQRSHPILVPCPHPYTLLQAATLETEFCGQRLSTASAANEPRRRSERLSRPTAATVSRGNVLLFCGGGNHVNLRGLPGEAEGISNLWPSQLAGGFVGDVQAQGLRLMAQDRSSLHAVAQDIPLVWPKANEAHIIFGSSFALMRPGRERLFLAPRRQLTEALPGLHEDRGLAARPLVAADNHVNVKRIELDSAADAAGLVRCDEGRTGAEERVDGCCHDNSNGVARSLGSSIPIKRRSQLATSGTPPLGGCAACWGVRGGAEG
jgi:hypothetical protein